MEAEVHPLAKKKPTRTANSLLRLRAMLHESRISLQLPARSGAGGNSSQIIQNNLFSLFTRHYRQQLHLGFLNPDADSHASKAEASS